MEALLQLAILLFLLGLGYGLGHYREQRHFRQLDRQEKELAHIEVNSVEHLADDEPLRALGLVTGTVVVATDYFKVFASSLRNLFGGELRSFETLIRRARREARVRMLLEARELGATAVIKMRYETSTVGGQQQKQAGGVEVVAYGTALGTPRSTPPPP